MCRTHSSRLIWLYSCPVFFSIVVKSLQHHSNCLEFNVIRLDSSQIRLQVKQMSSNFCQLYMRCYNISPITSSSSPCISIRLQFTRKCLSTACKQTQVVPASPNFIINPLNVIAPIQVDVCNSSCVSR